MTRSPAARAMTRSLAAMAMTVSTAVRTTTKVTIRRISTWPGSDFAVSKSGDTYTIVSEEGIKTVTNVEEFVFRDTTLTLHPVPKSVTLNNLAMPFRTLCLPEHIRQMNTLVPKKLRIAVPG